MASSNLIARLNAATQNANATLLLMRIVHYCRLKVGGVEFEGRKWTYRSIPEWAEETACPERTARRMLQLLKGQNLILTRMAWVGPKGDQKFVLHVALTTRTELLSESKEEDPPAKLAAPSGPDW